jgi:hypothetical protein
MKPTKLLLVVKNNKSLNSIAIVDRMEYVYVPATGTREHSRQILMRLNLRYRTKLTGKDIEETFEEMIDIQYEDYSRKADHIKIHSSEKNPDLQVFFFSWIFSHSIDHWATFLRKIKKDSDIRFVVKINVTDYDSVPDYPGRSNMVHHQLFGIINDVDTYFLADYCGIDNINSPIKW